jgi:hypothetical protein
MRNLLFGHCHISIRDASATIRKKRDDSERFIPSLGEVLGLPPARQPVVSANVARPETRSDWEPVFPRPGPGLMM